MNVLLVDAENLNGESFVFESYRLIERKYGPIEQCIAFGSSLHLQYLSKAKMHLGVQLVETTYAVKDQADRAIIKQARALATLPNKLHLIAIASGDGDFLETALWLRKRGVATACLSRSNILNKMASTYYDVCYPLDRHHMGLPTTDDRLTAINDCLHELPAGEQIGLDDAIRRLRKWRIVPKSVAGVSALNGITDFFNIHEIDGKKYLKLAAPSA